MGPILAIILAIAILGIYFRDSSAERESIRDAKKGLPPLATITLQKREIGRSRKGVVTYYQHYVLATIRTKNNEEKRLAFDYNHHDLNDLDAALQKARVWVHSAVTSSEQQ